MALAVAAAAFVACGGGGHGGHRSAASSGGAATTSSATAAVAATSTPTTGAPRGSPRATTAAAASSAVAAPAAAPPCGSKSTPPAVYDHVIWIWMENHSYNQVIGAAQAPYETALARQCGTATRYSSVGSPSLPNYIGATSGSTQGIADDAGPGAHPVSSDNLFRQVRASGRTERSYQEAMPGPCALGSSGRYAVKHNPAPYYVGPADRQACGADDVPLGTAQGGALAEDVANGTLPAFAFITPDLCSDTHDCGVSTGDAWLRTWVPRIVAGADYRAGRTAVFVVWDEDSPVPNIVVSPTTPATVSDVALDHYSLLRTTEEMLGIPKLLGRAANAPSMRTLFRL